MIREGPCSIFIRRRLDGLEEQVDQLVKDGAYDRALKAQRDICDLTLWYRGEDTPEYARRLNQLGKLHWLYGEYDASRTILKQALDISSRALGNDHPDVAILVNNLGEIYHSLGDLEKTEEHYRRALRILYQSLGRNHPEFMKSLQDLVQLLADKTLMNLSGGSGHDP